MDESETHILAIRDAVISFMNHNATDEDSSARIVMGTIYAIMVFMQQSTDEAEVSQAIKEVTKFFNEVSKQLLEVMPNPSEGAVVYHGPAGNA